MRSLRSTRNGIEPEKSVNNKFSTSDAPEDAGWSTEEPGHLLIPPNTVKSPHASGVWNWIWTYNNQPWLHDSFTGRPLIQAGRWSIAGRAFNGQHGYGAAYSMLYTLRDDTLVWNAVGFSHTLVGVARGGNELIEVTDTWPESIVILVKKPFAFQGTFAEIQSASVLILEP